MACWPAPCRPAPSRPPTCARRSDSDPFGCAAQVRTAASAIRSSAPASVGKSSRDPRLLGRAQRRAERRAFRNTARDEVGGLQRKHRRAPAARQQHKIVPAVVGDAFAPGARPRQQRAVEEFVRSEPVDQHARIMHAGRRGDLPPLVPHRREPVVFGIGEAQPLAQPLRILDGADGERAQPPHRIGRQRQLTFELRHVGEAREPRHPAQHRDQQPRLAHAHQRRHRMHRDQQLEHLGAHALARQRLEARARGDAGRQAGGIGQPAVAVGGVEAEEAQDAQIILRDPPRRIADEAHAPHLRDRRARRHDRGPCRRARRRARSS